jgi:2-amino-4-hydroxy-6-hydroxymethyldihydropteridine diphosphokinase
MRYQPRGESDTAAPLEVLLVGSNLDRERSIVAVLARLLELASPLYVSRIMETPAVGLIDNGPSFLNLAVAVPWRLPSAALKRHLNAIEESVGRSRRDVNRSITSRTADIDQVLRLAQHTRTIRSDQLPAEPYARAVLVDLLTSLGVIDESCEVPEYPTVVIPWPATPLGAQATLVSRGSWRQTA